MAMGSSPLTPEVKEYLTKQYYDPKFPGSFSGVDKFCTEIKNGAKYQLNRKDIEKWLQGEDTYTVNRSVQHKFKRNRVIVSGIDNQWDGDLMVLNSLAKYNNSYKYILLLIDIFSRYIWTVKMKTKTSEETINAMKQIFAKGRKPEILRKEKGREFFSKPFHEG